MAGGLGKRLMPLTKILPKPLIPLGAKSVMEMTVEKLKEQKFEQIIIATNYKSEMFESHFSDGSKWDIKITYSKEEKQLGTAGPLALISEIRKDNFIVINGDILTDLD